GLGVGLALLLGHRAPGDVRLDTNDRLDPLGLCRLVERDGPVERAVVGEGEAVETLRRGRIDEVADPSQPIEKAELRVRVEVREVVGSEGRHGSSIVPARRGDDAAIPGPARSTERSGT